MSSVPSLKSLVKYRPSQSDSVRWAAARPNTLLEIEIWCWSFLVMLWRTINRVYKVNTLNHVCLSCIFQSCEVFGQIVFLVFWKSINVNSQPCWNIENHWKSLSVKFMFPVTLLSRRFQDINHYLVMVWY